MMFINYNYIDISNTNKSKNDLVDVKINILENEVDVQVDLKI